MKRKIRETYQNKTPIVATVLIMAFMLLFVTGALVYYKTNNLLYHESVSQLQEISKQLFEKSNMQIELQWSYLEKVQEELNAVSSLTQQELTGLLEKSEKIFLRQGKPLCSVL